MNSWAFAIVGLFALGLLANVYLAGAGKERKGKYSVTWAVIEFSALMWMFWMAGLFGK